MASAAFIQDAVRLQRTGHENSFTDVCESYSLRASVKISSVDVGLKELHPVLRVSDVIGCFSREKKLDLLFTSHEAQDFKQFWAHFRGTSPNHEVYRHHQDELENCVPIYLHFDEGTSIKKKALLVAQWQPVLGFGSSRDPNDLNLLGASVKTRFLYSCMLGKVYGGKRKNKPLLKLVEHMAEELRQLFFEGLNVQLDGKVKKTYLIPIGVKGDWQGLAKIGMLTRNYLRDAPTKEFGKGICHLCKGGLEHHPWHHVDHASMNRAHDGAPLPWKKPSPLVSRVPGDPSRPAELFKIDLFHTCHKGCMADCAANAIVLGSLSKQMFSIFSVCRFGRSFCTINYLCYLFLQVTLIDLEVYGADGSYQDQLDRVYDDLQQFCRTNKLNLHMIRLTRTLIGYTSSAAYPTGHLGCA